MKMKKRFLSVLLSLVMVLGMVPGMSLTAYAADMGLEITCNPTGGGNVTKTRNSGSAEVYTCTATAASGYQFQKWTWHSDLANEDKDDTQNPRYFGPNGISNLTAHFVQVVDEIGLNLSLASTTLYVGNTATLTATVEPTNATDKKVKWSVGGTDAGAVKLYSDAECTTAVGADATETLTVYVKGFSAGSATVTATSNADGSKSASCTVTVSKKAPSVGDFTYTAPNRGFSTYNGTLKTATVVPKEGVTGMGNVTVKYYSGVDWDEANEVQSPINAGEYYVGITVAEGENYSAVSDVLHDSSWKFTINKATPIATNFTYNAPSNLTYSGTAKTATVVPKEGITGMGNVTVKYYSDQLCTNEVTPTNVDTYYVGITLSEGNNYRDASSALHNDDWSFTITKAAETAPAADTSNLNINYSEETISANGGYEVAADNNGTSITNFSAILENGTPTVYIRKTASDNNHDPSAWVAVTLAARPDAPNGLSTENASNGGTADGKIKGTTAAMEYKQKDSEGEWTTAMVDETAVVPGTYIVRVKATDAAPHGKATEVTVGSNYKALDDSTTVTIKKGESELSGVPVVDDVLTVSCEASDVTYQWYRGYEAISEASGTSYTVTKNDVGKAIKVVATQTKDSNGQEITGTKPTKDSAVTSAVVKKTPETLSTDDAKTKAGINYQTEQAAPDSGYEVSTDGTNKTESPISLTGIIDSESPKIYVRTAENDDTAAGAWVEVTIVARPDEPTGLTTESANTATSQDGKIKGTTGDMEYKLKGSEGAWTTATAGETLVASGTYLIRTKASSDKPAGKTAEVAVGSKVIILTDAQKPTAKTNLVFTGSKQALVNEPAENLPEGAKEIQYALGTKDTATQPYTPSIPTATNAGTYYIWYKVIGDENHNNTDPDSVTVTISPADKAALNAAIDSAAKYSDSIKDYTEIAATLNTAIEAARAVAANDNATPDAIADAVTKLNAATEAAKAAVEAAKNQAAAQAVIDTIKALPENATLNDKAAVEAARKAYDALTDAQKALVPADVLKKLTDAEAAIAAAEKAAADAAAAAQAVTDAIKALPESPTLSDKAAVEATRKAYDALTEAQEALVPADTLKKLTDAEAAIAVAEKSAAEAEKDAAAAQKVTDAIKALPEPTTLNDKAAIEAARKAYDALTDAQKKLVSADVLKKLTDAEAAIAAAEKATADAAAAQKVTEAIKALPEPATLNDKAAVEAARKAYDALTEAQKALVPADTLKKLTDAEAAIAAAGTKTRRISLRKCTITAQNRIYTGKAITPRVTVMYGDTKLKEGQDYTLSYKKVKQFQKVRVVVKGKGRFKGTRNAYFKIVPKGTAITKVSGGKKQFTVKWKKQKDITGFQIEYSLHSDFANSRRTYIRSDKTLSATIGKLKAGRTYYVRVRTYHKRNRRLFFSTWTEAVAVNTNGAKANEARVINIAVNVGDELDLNALATGATTWKSSDEAVATVSAEGVAKALAAGEATFTSFDANGEEIKIVMLVSDSATLELEAIDLTDFGGGIVEGIDSDEPFTTEEELELTLE